jgi:pimeloyl-ACP methyl ester carboxylesterase
MGIVMTQHTTATGDGYTAVEGTQVGALYALLRPDNWNGHLVLLLHGFVPVSEPVQLPPPGHDPLWSDIIDRLVSDGYGVAYSSYRANGMALHEGVLDTQVAQAEFTATCGTPDEIYLMGLSMGTQVGQALVESSSTHYDGFLAVSGALGGPTMQWEYFIDARILFDYYFPDALPGNAWSTTDLDFTSAVVPAVMGALQANPAAAVELAGIDQLKIAWTNEEELGMGILRALYGAGGGTGDLQARTGGIAIDNSVTRYGGSSDDIMLNAGVGRFAADPNAARHFARFDPTGNLDGTPVLALHTSRDPVAPHQFHFPAYQSVLAETGNAHLFETRLIDRFGHGEISADEVMESFHDLVIWAETGTVPQPP